MGILEHLNIRAMNSVLGNYGEDLDFETLFDYESVYK
jgi:hypothetical protein